MVAADTYSNPSCAHQRGRSRASHPIPGRPKAHDPKSARPYCQFPVTALDLFPCDWNCEASTAQFRTKCRNLRQAIPFGFENVH
jgi:hypothetical protein